MKCVCNIYSDVLGFNIITAIVLYYLHLTVCLCNKCLSPLKLIPHHGEVCSIHTISGFYNLEKLTSICNSTIVELTEDCCWTSMSSILVVVMPSTSQWLHDKVDKTFTNPLHSHFLRIYFHSSTWKQQWIKVRLST